MQNGYRAGAVSVHDADENSVAGIEHQAGNRFGNDSRTGTRDFDRRWRASLRDKRRRREDLRIDLDQFLAANQD